MVLLGLLRLSRAGTLHTGSSEMGQAETDDRRNYLFRDWRSVHRLELLVEGRTGRRDGDTDDGVVVGVLHT